MSLHGYHVGMTLLRKDPPFYALIMAAMIKADTDNTAKLTAAFPEVRREFQARYDAVLGVLPEDGVTDMDALAKRIDELQRRK
jgi:hypothetical protein